MTDPIRSRIQVFDPDQEYAVIERRLPHWAQPGTICFITWRTWDSIPDAVLTIWLAARDDWLVRHGIDSTKLDWKAQLNSLDQHLVGEFHDLVADRWNAHLDECHGACVLRRAELARIVADSLLKFDGDRYDLTDFVVMPNHVHLLAAFQDEAAMLAQCESWKHFTAVKINRELSRRRKRFWQSDGFDHLVRSVEQFEHLRRYIADNPRCASLVPGQYLHWSKKLL
jgi:type I restriction enzyme R subunit